MTEEQFVAELAGIETDSRTKLDDDSIGFLARLRAAGILQEDEWEQVKGFLRDALDLIASRNETTSTGKRGANALCIDADPRNADWLCIVRARKLSGFRLPQWAALWLWWLRTDFSDSFWKDVGEVARQMGFDCISERT